MCVTLVKLECLWCLDAVVCGKSQIILPFFLRELLAYWVVFAPLNSLKCVVFTLRATD